MLETSLLESSGRARSSKPATVLLSVALHGFVIGALLLVPIAQPQALPFLSAAIGLPLPVTASKPEIKPEVTRSARPVQEQITPDPGTMRSPQEIPTVIAMVVDDPADAIAAVAPIPRGEVQDLLRTIRKASVPEVASPPAPPPPTPAITHLAPIRVASISAGSLIHQVAPVYPPLAKLTHVQGVVILEAMVARDGTVQDIRVVSGHLLLQQAAVDAVKQWHYKPTILNGESVEIITTVTVNFTLH